jgi:hypothetical protein
MKLSLDARRAWLVAACFAGIIGLSFGVRHLLGFLPSFAQKCTTQCKASGREGHMVPVYPAAMTAGMRGEGQKECKCFAPGTFNPFAR